MTMPQYLKTWLIAVGAAAAAVAYGYWAAELDHGAPLVLLALGGLAVALCAMALFRIIDPLVRPAVAAARAETDRTSVRIRELTHEKQLVLKAIREIEHDYQMRKIDEADYKELTSRYRARAMRLIREIDAGDDFRSLIEQELKTRLVALEAAGTAAGTAAGIRPAGRAAGPVCGACSAINEADAKFCKKCGGALPATAAPEAKT
jgi:hypothetical protein